MIAEVKSHITATLAAAGIPQNRVAQEPKEKRTRKMPFAEITIDPEQITRDGTHTGRAYDPAAMTATNIRRTHRREITVRVRIAHRNDAEADKVLLAFLAGLGRTMTVPFPAPSSNSQSVRIIPGPAVWGGDPGILTDFAEVEPRILFKGGIYEEITDGTIQRIVTPTTNVN